MYYYEFEPKYTILIYFLCHLHASYSFGSQVGILSKLLFFLCKVSGWAHFECLQQIGVMMIDM